MLIALALALTAVPFVDVLGDPDLWWHIRLGRWILDTRSIPRVEMLTYTVGGTPITAHEWGFEVVVAVLSAAGGLLLVAAVVIGAAWSGALAAALRARLRSAPGWAVGVALVLGAEAMAPVTGVRPQMLSFALLGWTLWVADRHLVRGGRAVMSLVPLMVIWANVHAGFVAGIGALGVVTVVEALRGALHRPGAPSVTRIAQLAGATVMAAAAACLNPAGPAIYRYAVEVTSAERGKPIAEWQPLDPHMMSSWPFVTLAVLWVVLHAVPRWRPPLRDTVLGTIGIVAAGLAVRNLSVATALTVPGLAVMLGSAGSWLRLRPIPPISAVGRAAVVLAVCAVAAVVVARTLDGSSDGAQARLYPTCITRILAASPGDSRLAAPYAVSDYVAGHDWPHVLVYDYGESFSLGSDVLAQDIRIQNGAPDAMALLNASATDAVIAATAGPLVPQLRSAGWTPVTTDGQLSLWSRGNRIQAAPC